MILNKSIEKHHDKLLKESKRKRGRHSSIHVVHHEIKPSLKPIELPQPKYHVVEEVDIHSMNRKQKEELYYLHCDEYCR